MTECRPPRDELSSAEHLHRTGLLDCAVSDAHHCLVDEEQPEVTVPALSPRNAVVACVLLAVLGALGYVVYRKTRAYGHRAEALQLIGSARLREEAARAEYGYYFSINRDLGELCPARPRGTPQPWRPSCGTGANGPWSNLQIQPPDERSNVGIAVIATSGGPPPKIRVASHSFPSPALQGQWYAIYVEALEVNWKTGVTTRTRLLSTSESRNIWSEQE